MPLHCYLRIMHVSVAAILKKLRNPRVSIRGDDVWVVSLIFNQLGAKKAGQCTQLYRLG